MNNYERTQHRKIDICVYIYVTLYTYRSMIVHAFMLCWGIGGLRFTLDRNTFERFRAEAIYPLSLVA